MWLEGLETRAVNATASLDELRARLRVPLTQTGVDPVQVVDDLAAATEGGLLGSPGGRFYAWVIGGTTLSALAADWLTSTWDQNAGLYATSPASAVVEEVAGEWLLDLLDLPRDASFAFVTGCQMAHFTALAAARSGVLRGTSDGTSIGMDCSARRGSASSRMRRVTSRSTGRCVSSASARKPCSPSRRTSVAA